MEIPGERNGGTRSRKVFFCIFKTIFPIKISRRSPGTFQVPFCIYRNDSTPDMPGDLHCNL